ncbi:hypothetical protein R3379_36230 [Bacillus sp. BAU-SS-2023]|nr:hypothetical protein [Bacillus sp. BAU-SS-2023]
MEELKFNDLQEINGGSNLSYDLGKWVGGYLKATREAQRSHKPRKPSTSRKPYKTSYGTIWA